MKKVILRMSNREGICTGFIRYLLLSCASILMSASLYAQTISGKVTDESGIGMPGVNVVVKGTSTGTSTDADGAYSLQASGDQTVLVFSFIGYATQEVAVNGRTSIDVSMVLSAEQLSEVVVIGYGEVRQEAVTGSVVSMKGDEMREVPSPNFTQALQGRLAGVDMTQSSSKPGAAMQIRIRGTRSLSASNDPLVVLDGIPFAGSLSDINPTDIKSVDILKDASSTAIYGSRGANGVILVTTNKGIKGQKAQISYNGYYGIKTAFGEYPMMDGPKLAQLRADANMYSTPGADEDNGTSTDWQDLFYDNA
ncbi:MAG TPA: TonB-dependent receptor plug domain-containing protein, partial [Cyclobacteriaceae bacterium]